MNRLINYLKYMGIFIILELAISFIMSLLNLFGISSGITSLILFIFNILLFFIININNSKTKKKNGYLEGLLFSIILIILMIIIKLILFNNTFNISTYIYYIILILTGIFGGMIGINKKEEND